MSNRTPRNLMMLQQQISDSNPFKKTLVPRVFDIGSDFESDMQAVGLSGKSPEWRQEQAQEHRRRALRDLRDIPNPLKEYIAKTDEMDAATKKLPPLDRSDDYALKLRMELRQTLKTADPGQRGMLLAKPAYYDAFSETEPEASGLFLAEDFKGTISPEIQKDRDTVAAAKEKRRQDLHAPLVAVVAERRNIESEAMMVVNTIRGDIQTDSGLEPREFEAEAKRIETRADGPWLTNDRKQVVEIGADGKANYRLASVDEARDGRVFTQEVYAASRAA
jgi:hypothetical protein